MTLLSYIGLIGGVCSLAGYVPYARNVLRGKAPAPERASWLIWMLSTALILMSYVAIGATTTIWVPLAYFIGSAFITILAFTHGKEGWGVFEKLALVVAVISSIRWIYFDEPIVALALNMGIDFMGYLPSMKRLWKEKTAREDLDLEGWTLFFVGSIFNVIAVSPWTPVIYILPIFMFIMNSAMLALTLRNAMARERVTKEEGEE